MPDSAETHNFIKSSFRSVWALELLCVVKSEPGRAFTPPELVERLRGSDLAVRQSIANLEAAGLLVSDESGATQYAPASPEIDRLATSSETLYRRRPNFVRRLIVMSSSDQLTAFSDAFRLRKD